MERLPDNRVAKVDRHPKWRFREEAARSSRRDAGHERRTGGARRRRGVRPDHPQPQRADAMMPTGRGGSVKKHVVRLVVMLAASVGVVALVADAAYARITGNHCEPM